MKTTLILSVAAAATLATAAMADPAMKGDAPASGSEATTAPASPTQTGNTTAGVKPSSSSGASSGSSGSATAPQEKQGNGPNLPPSQRVDPENPASPGVNGSSGN